MSASRVVAVSGLAGVTALTLAVAVPSAAAPSARTEVPVRSGSYGYVDELDPDMVGFTVRNRRIIDPRFAIQIECRHSDGTNQSIAYGPTAGDSSRKFRIPRNGNGRVSWHLPDDPSLIPDATAHMGFTFTRRGRPQVTVEVEAQYSETDPATGERWTSTCYGVRPFRVARGPLAAR